MWMEIPREDTLFEGGFYMKSDDKQRIKFIDVENLNIVDKDGNVKFTLFSKGNVPPPLMNGRDILPGHRQDDPNWNYVLQWRR